MREEKRGRRSKKKKKKGKKMGLNLSFLTAM